MAEAPPPKSEYSQMPVEEREAMEKERADALEERKRMKLEHMKKIEREHWEDVKKMQEGDPEAKAKIEQLEKEYEDHLDQLELARQKRFEEKVAQEKKIAAEHFQFVEEIRGPKAPDVMHYDKRKFSRAQLSVYKIFCAFDKNNDGYMNRKELKAMLEKIGSPERDVKSIMEQVDTSRDGLIDYHEFLAWIWNEAPKELKGYNYPDAAVASLMYFVNELFWFEKYKWWCANKSNQPWSDFTVGFNKLDIKKEPEWVCVEEINDPKEKSHFESGKEGAVQEPGEENEGCVWTKRVPSTTWVSTIADYIKYIFDWIDSNKSGTLTLSELVNGVKKLKFQGCEQMIPKIFYEIDMVDCEIKDGEKDWRSADSRITFDEFEKCFWKARDDYKFEHPVDHVNASVVKVCDELKNSSAGKKKPEERFDAFKLAMYHALTE